MLVLILVLVSRRGRGVGVVCGEDVVVDADVHMESVVLMSVRMIPSYGY